MHRLCDLLSDLPDHDVVTTLHRLKLKSYVLLCHSAFEEYLEKVSTAVLVDSLGIFEEDGIIRDPLLSALSYYRIVIHREVLGERSTSNQRDVLLSLFKSAISEHHKALEGINGVKTKDQDAILAPIGIRLFDFDRLLSQGLNSYGETRGRYAHSFGIKSITPRAGQIKTAVSILNMLKGLDNLLCECHRISYSHI
ncbi:MAG: HEPN domain-containing protein [Marivita sp.]|uniref:HEPN domain-containing protein n=1 Tax=Marivita sp. TaxID=2003365 RepID=UPI003EF148E2